MSLVRAIDVVVVGAGHNGLAMSHGLARRGIDHVVLERGEVASSWRTERWDSMRLLTPNWMVQLPAWRYAGDDPDGFMSAADTAAFIAGYAHHLAAPVRTHTTVTAVRREGAGYRVETDRGAWQCRALVIASGAFGQPNVPRLAAQVPPGVAQLNASDYRRPSQLEDGGVLIVGASATGVQLAREIHLSGRPVTLAVGEHVRLPRLYRGRDIYWWMRTIGLLDRRIEDEPDRFRAQHVSSPQLIGTPERSSLDLNTLRSFGVDVVGRLVGIRDASVAQFSGSLRNVCALADLKLNRLLDSIDVFAACTGLDREVGPVERFESTLPALPPRLTLTLGREVRTVVWATGYRPRLPWLQVDAFHANGALRHDRGVVDAPGLYMLGLPFMRRRQSSFIHGCADDARELGAHLADYLRQRRHATVALHSVQGDVLQPN